ncbi:MAG TPA: diacylglycerol kinase family protein, partial [Chthoniobacteraceae bacterium]
MEDTLVILNPAARGERAKGAWAKIQRLPNAATIQTTSAPGDARAIAAWAVEKGYRTVVAAGGDGTINEVVNGLAGSEVALGILPVGTMNVFAAELGLPSDLQEAWKVIRARHLRKIDLARANSQYFVQLAGVGLDAQVVQATSWEFKKNFGPLSYLVSAAQIAARKPPKLVVTGEDGVREGSFVLIGNGRFYGGPFPFFKDAKIDDGKLDVLIFKNLGYLDIARYLAGIITGTHTELKDVEYFQTRKA